MSEKRTIRRRESFNEVAELYDAARPTYPVELIDDVVNLTNLGSGSRVLEIGCGTGQMTLPLAERGAHITCVELGANLAPLARRKLARFDNVEVVVADFDEWTLPESPFDLVVSATSFHWLNPVIRMQKCSAALRPGGVLAIVETHWGVGPRRDEFSQRVQTCYARWDPNHDPGFLPPTWDTLPKAHDELDKSGQFESIKLRRFRIERTYNATGYCDLIRTFSDVRALDEPAREGLLGCIATLIDSQFGGALVRNDSYSLWLAISGRTR